MQVPIGRIEEMANGLFETRGAVTRDEVLRAAAEQDLGGEAEQFLALLPPGAYARDDLLGVLRAMAASYEESVPTRTSDYD